jgi:DNA helicase II / ATP-dependent DNA helicase PcrA
VTLAEDFAKAAPEAGIADLMAELDRRAAIQHAPVAEGVTLATLHAAKGLEWGCVFIVGAHEGTLPISYAQTPAQLEEERRLFYVGVTRAKDQLSVSWSTSRSPGGRGQRGPTRFLDPIGVRTSRPASSAQPYQRSSRTARQPVPKCRVCGRGLLEAGARKLGRCEDCPSSMDQGLYDQLSAWRADRAKVEKVPVFVVFTDATLTAIAENRPTDERALLRIAGIGRVKVGKYGDDVIRICRR